ncbi:hypothetical protein SCA6_005544 [Theobroma cacao]
MAPDPDAVQEAQRLKALAETKYKNSNLKSALKHAKKAHRLFPNLEGISSMLTAFKILRAASQADASPDWYSILQGVLDLPFLPLKLLDRFLLEAIANKTVVGLE